MIYLPWVNKRNPHNSEVNQLHLSIYPTSTSTILSQPYVVWWLIIRGMILPFWSVSTQWRRKRMAVYILLITTLTRSYLCYSVPVVCCSCSNSCKLLLSCRRNILSRANGACRPVNPFSMYIDVTTHCSNPCSHQAAVCMLTHDKMAATSQTIYSDASSWTKRFVFWLKFHWTLFLVFQFTIIIYWLR